MLLNFPHPNEAGKVNFHENERIIIYQLPFMNKVYGLSNQYTQKTFCFLTIVAKILRLQSKMAAGRGEIKKYNALATCSKVKIETFFLTV